MIKHLTSHVMTVMRLLVLLALIEIRAGSDITQDNNHESKFMLHVSIRHILRTIDSPQTCAKQVTRLP